MIWDMDPGIDDAVALLLALSRDVQVDGITTVAGNVEVQQTTKNALRVLGYMGRLDIPVGMGMPKPLVRELHTCREVHGEDGLGECGLPEPEAEPVHFLELWRYPPHKAICTGPLTNVAVALLSIPNLSSALREVIIMGGALHLKPWGCGNVTADSEFNFYVDPEAAKIVLESGIPITLIPLDVTADPKLAFTRALLEELEPETPPARLVSHMLDFMLGRQGSVNLHDVVAVAYLIDPSMFEVEEQKVKVELYPVRGKLVRDPQGVLLNVCLSVSPKDLIQVVLEGLGFRRRS